ncbi:MFS transporter [Pararhizobium mangrovi]|uniref:MFS transporter n=1 Tax=Pararhizobium mangrovi TaxID=2590452 RepID=A0A506TWM7_9HYPH|nr:MFS transporter [Pararhizobium mangrovi]TPW26473.1 MFS transporter [Pararhizobium mangrovi]
MASQSTVTEDAHSGARREFFTLFPSIMLPMFLAVVDQTIVATALPAIAESFGDVERISWVVISYLVAATIAAPVYGRLGDALGRRRLMFIAIAIFMVASLVCAASVNLMMLVAGRVLQGFGGGGLMTLSQALVGEAVPPRARARFQGYLASVAVTSSMFGPVAGGFLTQYFGWPSIFLVNIPVGFAAIALVTRVKSRPTGARAGRFDAGGLGLFAAFVASFLIMLEQAQKLDAALLPSILTLIAVTVLAAIVLVWRELRAPDPLFPVHVFRNPSIWRCDLLASCHGAVLVSLITYLPIYLRVTRDASAGEIGVFLLPMMACVGIGSMTTGQIVSRTGRAAIMPSVGLMVVAFGMAVLGFAADHMTNLQLSLALAVTSLFIGTVMGVVQVTVQTAAGPAMLGTAAASVQFSRSLGAAFGAATIGAILFAVLTILDPQATAIFAKLFEPTGDPLTGVSKDAIAMVQGDIRFAFNVCFLTISAIAAGASALAWSIPMRRI